MKRKTLTIMVFAITLTSMSSCATLLGGKVRICQKTKPEEGEPARKIRTIALIADIFFWPAIVVDFATSAIYKPCGEKYK